MNKVSLFGEDISLDDICSENTLVLVDSCSLGDEKKENFRFNFSPNYLEKRYMKACRACKNLSMWNEKVREHQEIYFTREVVNELDYYWNRKVLEDLNLLGYFGGDNKVRDCIMTIIENISFANKIIGFSKRDSRIIDFRKSQPKLYSSLFGKYNDIYGKVGKTDSRILVSGMIISELGYFPAIITADKKMVSYFNNFVKNGDFNRMSFYGPSEDFNFKEYFIYKD